MNFQQRLFPDIRERVVQTGNRLRPGARPERRADLAADNRSTQTERSGAFARRNAALGDEETRRMRRETISTMRQRRVDRCEGFPLPRPVTSWRLVNNTASRPDWSSVPAWTGQPTARRGSFHAPIPRGVPRAMSACRQTGGWSVPAIEPTTIRPSRLRAGAVHSFSSGRGSKPIRAAQLRGGAEDSVRCTHREAPPAQGTRHRPAHARRWPFRHAAA
jgi:hypothetical protein